jgi:hypothetical protein
MIGALLTRSRRMLGLAALCSVTSVPRLWADPVTVTSGRFVVPWDDPTNFQFAGTDGLFLGGVFSLMASSPHRTCFQGCAPGTFVDMSAVAGGESPFMRFTLGTSTGAVINGTEFVTPSQPATGLTVFGRDISL